MKWLPIQFDTRFGISLNLISAKASCHFSVQNFCNMTIQTLILFQLISDILIKLHCNCYDRIFIIHLSLQDNVTFISTNEVCALDFWSPHSLTKSLLFILVNELTFRFLIKISKRHKMKTVIVLFEYRI